MKILLQATLPILLTLPFTIAELIPLQCADPSANLNSQAVWSPWTKIDGPELSAAPTVATRDGDGMEVFALTNDTQVARWVHYQGSWAPYQNLQSGVSSEPYPVVDHDETTGGMTLFVKADDDSLASIPCSTSRCLDSWVKHGGVLKYAPNGVSFEKNRMDVFVVNTGYSVSWRTFYDGVPEVSWKSLPNPGALVGKVAAVSRMKGIIDLFGIGTDNKIFHRSYIHSDGTWTKWVRLHERIVTSTLSVVSVHPLRIDLFVRGEENDLLQTSWINGKWSGFSSLGGVLTSGPGAVARSGNRMDVFARGTDMKLYQKSFA